MSSNFALPVQVPRGVPVGAAVDGDVRVYGDRHFDIRIECCYIYSCLGAQRKPMKPIGAQHLDPATKQPRGAAFEIARSKALATRSNRWDCRQYQEMPPMPPTIARYCTPLLDRSSSARAGKR